MLKTAPSITFGTGTRDAYYIKDYFPGPNQYFASPSEAKHKKGAFLAGKYRHQSSELVPGPGAYDPVKPQSEQSCRIGTSQKHNFVEKDAGNKPGPGSYNIRSQSDTKAGSKCGTFSTGPRAKFVENPDTPGYFFQLNV